MNINIRLYATEFEQDIRPLVMAFYPGSAIRVQSPESRTLPFSKEEEDLRLDVEPDAGEEGERLHIALLRDGREVKSLVFPFSEAGDRTERKNLLKRQLYRLLEKDTGKTLPWGTLTGIRPVKLPMGMLKEGVDEDGIRRVMEEEYFTSPGKIALATEIAKRERKLLQRLDYEKGYSLYVGIPFCPSTCAYCSFTSYPIKSWEKQVDRYLDTMERELDFISGQCDGKVMDTLYIGGGTPTTLTPRQLDRLFGMLQERFPVEAALEWTVEAGRPDSITAEKLAVMKTYPVNRISINPQTMKQETLKLIGRRHTVEQTVEAFRLAREMGFDNINMDLILGLPGETQEDVENTMAQIAGLRPDSLTIHSLAIKRAARLNTEKEAFQGKRIVNTEALYDLTARLARQMGLLPYYLYRQKNMAGNLENVGYGTEGKFGLYNILIMEEVQSIYGAGAGAASKILFSNGRHERADNVKDVGQYMARIDEMIERKKAVLA